MTVRGSSRQWGWPLRGWGAALGLALMVGACSAAEERGDSPTVVEGQGTVSTPAPADEVTQPSAMTGTATSTAVSDPEGVVCAERAKVVSVVDGDTIHVEIEGGGDESVRYIGVDSPERGDPYFAESRDANEGLAGGKSVCLERDITDRDRFGRLLRYVWLDDGALVNEALLALGAATISTYPPDVKYVESRYLPAQHQAQENGVGIWGPGGAPPEPSPGQATPSAVVGGNCHASYPSVCIPPPPPDLDCKDVPHRRFVVTGADPHRFDSDGDGVGCESG